VSTEELTLFFLGALLITSESPTAPDSGMKTTQLYYYGAYILKITKIYLEPLNLKNIYIILKSQNPASIFSPFNLTEPFGPLSRVQLSSHLSTSRRSNKKVSIFRRCCIASYAAVASILRRRPTRCTAAALVPRAAPPLFPSHVQRCRCSSPACSASAQMEQSAPPPPRSYCCVLLRS